MHEALRMLSASFKARSTAKGNCLACGETAEISGVRPFIKPEGKTWLSLRVKLPNHAAGSGGATMRLLVEIRQNVQAVANCVARTTFAHLVAITTIVKLLPRQTRSTWTTTRHKVFWQRH